MTLPSIPYNIPTGTYRCRTLYLVEKDTKQDCFVFSVCEKLEPDMQDFNDAILWDRAKGSGKAPYKLYIVSCDINVTDAFIENPIGNFVMDNGHDVITPKFFYSSFFPEPGGKAYMILPDNYSKGIGRVLPKRPDTFHVKAYLDDKRVVVSLFKEHSYLQEQLAELSVKYFGIDLWEFKEHLGNCYLCWHNETFKCFRIKGNNNPTGVIVDIFYRSDRRDAFKVHLCDIHHKDCIVADYTWDVPARVSSLFIPTECFPSLNSISIYSENGMLIYKSEFAKYLTAIDMKIGISEKAVSIKVKEEDGTERTLEPVSKFKYADSFIGESKQSADSYFSKNEVYHHIKELEEKREFLFFNGSKDGSEKAANKQKAKEAVLDLINRADSICYLCDPYFNEDDFIDFVTQATSLNVKIRIINSKAELKNEILLSMKQMIADYNNHLGIDDHVQCRVLRGGESMLHDRFIVVDDYVWYMGSSFSEFGTRACSLALLAPSASLAVKTYIEEWWNSDEYTMPIEEIEPFKAPGFFRRLFFGLRSIFKRIKKTIETN